MQQQALLGQPQGSLLDAHPWSPGRGTRDNAAGHRCPHGADSGGKGGHFSAQRRPFQTRIERTLLCEARQALGAQQTLLREQMSLVLREGGASLLLRIWGLRAALLSIGIWLWV